MCSSDGCDPILVYIASVTATVARVWYRFLTLRDKRHQLSDVLLPTKETPR